MTAWKCLGASVLIASMLSAQQATDDPVLKAREQRAAAAGSEDGDLPPVPRGILEPPPLPPPIVHVKDTKGYRPSRKVKRSPGSHSKRAKGMPGSKPVTKKPRKRKP